jgi:hypothetical protein
MHSGSSEPNMDSNWSRKGATFSDKSARQEFGLTQQEIVVAIRAGELQYRENHIHGNPYLRLLRQEVEALVRDKSGQDLTCKRRNSKRSWPTSTRKPGSSRLA